MPMPHTLRREEPAPARRAGSCPQPGDQPSPSTRAPRAVGCGARGAQHRLGMSSAQQSCSPWHTPHGGPALSPSPRPHLGLLPKTWEELVQGGAQAPCTPWLQGADPWSRSRALPVVQSITSTTTSTPALPAGNTCAGRSERGNPPPVPPGGSAAGPNNGGRGQRPAGCACASSPCSTAAPWHGTAPLCPSCHGRFPAAGPCRWHREAPHHACGRDRALPR